MRKREFSLVEFVSSGGWRQSSLSSLWRRHVSVCSSGVEWSTRAAALAATQLYTESQTGSHQRSSFSESFKLSFQDIPLTTRPSWPRGDFLGSSLIRSRRLTLTCWRTWWLERRFSLTLWLNRFETQSSWLSPHYFFLCFLSLTNMVWDQAERDVGLVRQLGLNLQFVLNTHVHADHITGTGERWNTSKVVSSPSYISIKSLKWYEGRLKRLLPNTKSVISKASGAKADILVSEGDTVRFEKN